MKLRKAVKATSVFLLLILIGISCCLVFRPWVTRTESRREAEYAADAFLQTYCAPTEEPAIPQSDNNETSQEPANATAMPRADLYEAMKEYNERIYLEGQSGLCDPWSYTVPAIDLSAYGLETGEALGVLQISSIDVSLPIYSGASYDNLAKGAAVLTQTSLPIGGENTNCVIGAHRGWNAEDYLRDVEEVQLGDDVVITNFWGELHYTVTEIKVIEPDDIAQILIQPGRELLTVFTCHPYASGGRYRYLLICEREEEAPEPPASEATTEQVTQQSVVEQTPVEPTVCIDREFESAEAEIRIVAMLPWMGLTVITVLLIVVITILLHKKKR